MRRKLFFLLERLQMTRRERITVGILAGCLALLSVTNLYLEQKAVYDEEYYTQLEKVFAERSAESEREREEILARYYPDLQESEPLQLSEQADELPDTVSAEEKVNINEADAEELQTLPGIGPAYAERIIEWRTENGMFTEPEQLLEIRGIGERRLEALIPYLEF